MDAKMFCYFSTKPTLRPTAILNTRRSTSASAIVHTGPTLPAFITPEILKVLQEKFNIGTISTVDEDLKTLIG